MSNYAILDFVVQSLTQPVPHPYLQTMCTFSSMINFMNNLTTLLRFYLLYHTIYIIWFHALSLIFCLEVFFESLFNFLSHHPGILFSFVCHCFTLLHVSMCWSSFCACHSLTFFNFLVPFRSSTYCPCSATRWYRAPGERYYSMIWYDMICCPVLSCPVLSYPIVCSTVVSFPIFSKSNWFTN